MRMSIPCVSAECLGKGHKVLPLNPTSDTVFRMAKEQQTSFMCVRDAEQIAYAVLDKREPVLHSPTFSSGGTIGYCCHCPERCLRKGRGKVGGGLACSLECVDCSILSCYNAFRDGCWWVNALCLLPGLNLYTEPLRLNRRGSRSEHRIGLTEESGVEAEGR